MQQAKTKPSYKAVAPNDFVRLTHFGNGSSNFYQFREHIIKQTSLMTENDLSTLSSIPREGSITEIVKPKHPKDNSSVYVIEEWRENFKEYRKDVKKLATNCRFYYNHIWHQISHTSQNLLRVQPEFPACENDQNPVILWKLIISTHVASVTNAKKWDAASARLRYGQIVQQAAEPDADFRNRLHQASSQLTALSDDSTPDEALAYDFLVRLDRKRHGKMAEAYLNAALSGPPFHPGNIDESLRYVASFQGDGAASGGASRDFNLEAVVTTDTVFSVDTPPIVKESSRPSKPNKKKKVQKVEDKQQRNKSKSTATIPDASEKSFRLAPSPCGIDVNGVPCTQLHYRQDHNRFVKLMKKSETVNLTRLVREVESVSVCSLATRVERVLSTSQQLLPTDVQIDSQATNHLFRNRHLLANVRRCQDPRTFVGIGGSIKAKCVGDFFGMEVYYSPKATGNIISQCKYLEDFGSESFEYVKAANAYSMQLSGRVFIFTPKNRLYVCDLSHSVETSLATVVENESHHTTREVSDANKARELIRRLGYPSHAALINLINKGGLVDCDVTSHAVMLASRIYGPEIPAVKGKSTRSTPPAIHLESYQITYPKIVLYLDIFFVLGESFLLSVSSNGISIVTHLGKGIRSRSGEQLKLAIISQVGEHRAKNFQPTLLIIDGEKGILPIAPSIKNELHVDVQSVGPGQHVTPVERKIRVIKERTRSILSSLPYKLPLSLIKYAIFYATVCINIMPNAASVISPREIHTGRKVSAKRDLRAAFGDYCETVTAVITNTMKPRTESCIALYPKGNVTGSYVFYNLETNLTIVRDQWTLLPIPATVIATVNRLASADQRDILAEIATEINSLPASDEEESDETSPVSPDVPMMPTEAAFIPTPPVAALIAGSSITDPSIAGSSFPVDLTAAEQNISDHITDANTPELSIAVSSAPVAATPPEDKLHEVQSASDQLHSEVSPGTDELSDPVVPGIATPASSASAGPLPHRYNTRSRSKHDAAEKDFLFHISVKKALKTMPKKALAAMVKEIQQLESKHWAHPVNPRSLSHKALRRVIRSSMFLKEKYLPSGAFDKLRARLVANGNMQDNATYDASDISSPTASIPSLFMVAAIAAKEDRQVFTMDIASAYLNAELTKKKVHMSLDKTMADILLKVKPEYKDFLLPNGTIVMELDKALYGCVESAKLWYDLLRSTLEESGYIANPSEPCVLNKMHADGKQSTCVLYVDDLFITTHSPQHGYELRDHLLNKFKEATFHEGPVHSYLGMTFDFSIKGEVKVSQEGYVAELLNGVTVEGTASTPAAANLLTVNFSSPPLSSQDRDDYHSVVARLLYLAKRTRPDLLTAVSFLTTRTHAPSAEDRKKLERALKYLRGTAELGLRFKPVNNNVTGYVDASFAVHMDYKSHTGLCVQFGGTIFAKSTKQKINTKSSTEAELVGLSDSVSHIIWCRAFLLHQGYTLGPATVYQDNQSTMAMLKNGRSHSNRTRHINIRYYWAKDAVDQGDIAIDYLPTEEMLADILTKPLQGELFVKLRKMLLNLLI